MTLLVPAAVALAGLLVSIGYMAISLRHREQVREANAMRKHDPDSAAAREYLLGKWLTSYHPGN